MGKLEQHQGIQEEQELPTEACCPFGLEDIQDPLQDILIKGGYAIVIGVALVFLFPLG